MGIRLHFTRRALRTASGLFAVTFALPAHALLGGTLDPSTSVYAYVGKLSNGYAATPIGASWLLTAAHVAPKIGATYTSSEGKFNVTKIVKDPLGSDVCLVGIDGSLGHTYGYAAATLGGQATFVGLGAVGKIGTSATTSAKGGRYLAHNTLDALMPITLRAGGPVFNAYVYDLDDGTAAHNTTGAANAVAGEGGIGTGDSGGGWFVDVHGRPTLVAVSTGVLAQAAFVGFGTANYYEYGGVGFGASVADASAFIQANAHIPPVPEPLSFAALAVGAAGLRRRRRRR